MRAVAEPISEGAEDEVRAAPWDVQRTTPGPRSRWVAIMLVLSGCLPLVFWHFIGLIQRPHYQFIILLPIAASLLVLVRTIALFELTFLTAGPDSQTLVVALYYAVFAAGVRAPQSVDAMAMIYMIVTLVWLLIALRLRAARHRRVAEEPGAIDDDYVERVRSEVGS